ncbi:hypothetical protein MAPG_11590, partial [Magnaporthiopsis poae ATCC 64411]
MAAADGSEPGPASGTDREGHGSRPRLTAAAGGNDGQAGQRTAELSGGDSKDSHRRQALRQLARRMAGPIRASETWWWQAMASCQAEMKGAEQVQHSPGRGAKGMAISRDAGSDVMRNQIGMTRRSGQGSQRLPMCQCRSTDGGAAGLAAQQSRRGERGQGGEATTGVSALISRIPGVRPLGPGAQAGHGSESGTDDWSPVLLLCLVLALFGSPAFIVVWTGSLHRSLWGRWDQTVLHGAVAVVEKGFGLRFSAASKERCSRRSATFGATYDLNDPAENTLTQVQHRFGKSKGPANTTSQPANEAEPRNGRRQLQGSTTTGPTASDGKDSKPPRTGLGLREGEGAAGDVKVSLPPQLDLRDRRFQLGSAATGGAAPSATEAQAQAQAQLEPQTSTSSSSSYDVPGAAAAVALAAALHAGAGALAHAGVGSSSSTAHGASASARHHHHHHQHNHNQPAVSPSALLLDPTQRHPKRRVSTSGTSGTGSETPPTSSAKASNQREKTRSEEQQSHTPSRTPRTRSPSQRQQQRKACSPGRY